MSSLSEKLALEIPLGEVNRTNWIACPLLVLWGAEGVIERTYDTMAVWGARAGEVSGRALPCGHFLPEEAPEETLAELEAFL